MIFSIFFLFRIFLSLLSFTSFFIAPVLAMLAVERMLPVRKKIWAKPVLLTGCFLLTGMIIFVGDPVNLPGALLPFGLAVFLCCEGTLLQRFSITLILASLGLSFNALIDSVKPFIGDGIYFNNILRFLIWLMVFVVLKRFAPKQQYHLPGRLWILIDVLTLTPFAATLITVLLGDPYNSLGIQDAFLLPVVTLTSFGLLWAVVVLAHQQKLEEEKKIYQLNQMYFRNLEQEQFQVRKLRHDMVNHLQTMSTLPAYEMQEYLHQLIQSPGLKLSRKFCENRVVNAIISAKCMQMEQYEISDDFTLAIPPKLPIENVDLCALFANSLDNAIEACKKLPKDMRKIILKVRVDKGLLVLQIQNPVIEKPHIKNGRISTTKEGLKTHGFGLASIREVTERYGGFLNITMEEGRFILLLSLSVALKADAGPT